MAFCLKRSLQWLRGPNKNVELELETIRSNIQSTQTRTNIFPTITLGNLMTLTSVQAIYTKIKSVLKNVRIVKPLSITCGLMVFQRFTGTKHVLFEFSIRRVSLISLIFLSKLLYDRCKFVRLLCSQHFSANFYRHESTWRCHSCRFRSIAGSNVIQFAHRYCGTNTIADCQQCVHVVGTGQFRFIHLLRASEQIDCKQL